MSKLVTFEIEYYDGSTMMAFQVDISDPNNPKVLKTKGCDHADTDGDYIFNESECLIRIQSEDENLVP